MNASHCPFSKIINGNTQFVIPVFQRDYRWTEAECEQLWKDILQIAAAPDDRNHFIGSVVSISTGDCAPNFTRWLLIDGQQRLTTVTLLLTALRDHIRESHWQGSENGPTERRIEAYFLKNLEERGNRELKLMLRRHDHDTLQALLTRQEMPAQASKRIQENYDYFREQLVGVDLEQVYAGIGRLLVVNVTLDRNDDPQLIFESLNSTGMDLSQSDLIRNFILMRLPEDKQTSLYEKYWINIESLFRGSERTFDGFIRDYLALKTEASKQERADQIYFAFRRLFGSVAGDPNGLESFLEELRRFAGYHAAFSIGVNAPEGLKEPLARLRHLVDVPATLVMRLYDCFNRLHTLREEDFARALSLIESYVFRRAICGGPTNSYWQEFANIAYHIDQSCPLESLGIGLALLRDNYRFPSDEDFRKALEERNIYGLRVRRDLLERLENHGNREPTDTSNLQIEHIMPQNPRVPSEWRKMLGEEWEKIHGEWLHRLGNLTLTGYNSTYSDRPFEEKKMIPGGFRESAVRLNGFVKDQPVWTAHEIAIRGKALAAKALTIWQPLVVSRDLIDEARKQQKRDLAKRRDVSKVKMSAAARLLFEVISGKIKELDEGIVELAEQKSVSYHGPEFFLEVLPRKHRLNLLLALDFNEVDDPAGIAEDASQMKFVVNAQHEGGVNVPIYVPADIDKAMPMIRQAHLVASA